MLPEILKENAKIVYKYLKIVMQISGPYFAVSDN